MKTLGFLGSLSVFRRFPGMSGLSVFESEYLLSGSFFCMMTPSVMTSAARIMQTAMNMIRVVLMDALLPFHAPFAKKYPKILTSFRYLPFLWYY